jgi:hypothetical protein
MACVDSSSLPETNPIPRPGPQPGNDTSAPISQFGIDLQIFSLTFYGCRQHHFFWHGFPNGAVSTGHPAILSITQLACCSTIEKREVA